MSTHFLLPVLPKTFRRLRFSLVFLFCFNLFLMVMVFGLVFGLVGFLILLSCITFTRFLFIVILSYIITNDCLFPPLSALIPSYLLYFLDTLLLPFSFSKSRPPRDSM